MDSKHNGVNHDVAYVSPRAIIWDIIRMYVNNIVAIIREFNI